jgi:hypothetical protein
MNREAFEKWYSDNKDRLHLTDRFAAQHVWEACEQHYRAQSEPICSLCNGAGELQMTDAGPDSEFSECHECDGTGKSNIQPLFAHAMPKSEPIAWYYRFKDAKGWRLWNINLGPDKPVNVAFEDMEARPLVFGDQPTPQPTTDVSELEMNSARYQWVKENLIADYIPSHVIRDFESHDGMDNYIDSRIIAKHTVKA